MVHGRPATITSTVPTHPKEDLHGFIEYVFDDDPDHPQSAINGNDMQIFTPDQHDMHTPPHDEEIHVPPALSPAEQFKKDYLAGKPGRWGSSISQMAENYAHGMYDWQPSQVAPDWMYQDMDDIGYASQFHGLTHKYDNDPEMRKNLARIYKGVNAANVLHYVNTEHNETRSFWNYKDITPQNAPFLAFDVDGNPLLSNDHNLQHGVHQGFNIVNNNQGHVQTQQSVGSLPFMGGGGQHSMFEVMNEGHSDPVNPAAISQSNPTPQDGG